MHELALFAGAGGGLLATKHLLGWKTVCYVERDSYCVDVLQARIKDGFLDDAPIWDDVRGFRRDNSECGAFVDALAKVDNLIITAGFPCQPFSCAGKQQGADDERDMWPETARVIREIKPAGVLLENVPGLVSSGYILTVLDDLAKAGYAALPPVRLAASDVGAPHRRWRYWIVAYAKSAGLEIGDGQSGREKTSSGLIGGLERYGSEIPDANGERRDGRAGLRETARTARVVYAQGGHPWWAAEPQLGRVADGVAHRVERIRAIGQGQVPAVAACVWRDVVGMVRK